MFYFPHILLKKDIFPNLNIDEVDFLIKQIIREKPELIKIGKVPPGFPFSISPTGLIKSFLENRGFSKLEKDIEESALKKKEREKIELELAESNIRANNLNAKVAKRNKRETIINIIIGLINIGILIWQSLLIVESSK